MAVHKRAHSQQMHAHITHTQHPLAAPQQSPGSNAAAKVVPAARQPPSSGETGTWSACLFRAMCDSAAAPLFR
jgi:hypothetical protein